ncbi:hypothetical protein [Nesterenkonia sp. Act20]|uniref:hypothetical protein n=1 Tax=Nesterenkonia sp. Act20 TaxID=1483432 RepID=UPI001C45B193|nr:hypothetical protein [Nesterenkonia sp. Act20]
MIQEITNRLNVAPGQEIQDYVTLNGTEVHFKFIRAPFDSAPLVIRFHGAVKRDLRPLPAFQANLKSFSDNAHQISICDPTMMSRDGFSCSWYAGHEGLDVQSVLLEFIAAVKSSLSPSRTIYLGSSGGGFAALYFSYHDPESLALVMVPQTNLERHFSPGAVVNYLQQCWPGRSLEQASKETCLDVTSLYASGFNNSVVYVQSQGDFKHNALQLTPFLTACYKTGEPEDEKVILSSDYWGKPGHGGAVPAEGYTRWLRTALTSPSLGVEDLLATSAMLASQSVSGSTRREETSTRVTSESDIGMAKVVKAGLLKQSSIS